MTLAAGRGAWVPPGQMMVNGGVLTAPRVPLAGARLREAAMARICRTPSVLLAAGIPREAPEALARVSGDRRIAVIFALHWPIFTLGPAVTGGLG